MKNSGREHGGRCVTARWQSRVRRNTVPDAPEPEPGAGIRALAPSAAARAMMMATARKT